ncbi:terminase large subunit domain-containing protein [Caenispirillum bisanense]|uniref:Terminase-like family protein n=1 Tax=Caenispirillum bisanense TaxID=414052 RepID=A0A286GNI7_9PROT|nr:Terminase-like family protein [Caenispirillum bisanense]
MVPSKDGPPVVAEFSERERAEITEALSGKYSTVVLCWPRRHGKTVATALIILWRFLTRTHQKMALVGNNEKQAIGVAFETVRGILEATPYFQPMMSGDSPSIVIMADKITYKPAKNEICAYANNSTALYGYKFALAQVTEYHAAKNNKAFDTAASATIDTEGGLVLIDSTVGSRTSPLYKLYKDAEDPESGVYYSHIYYANNDDAFANCPKWISLQALKHRSRTMLPLEWAQQHLNNWAMSSDTLFRPDVMARMTADAYPLDLDGLTAGRGFMSAAALDRAWGDSSHGDATVTSCVVKVREEEDECYYVVDSSAVDGSTGGGIKANFLRYEHEYKIKRAAFEVYNAQDVFNWAQTRDYDSKTISVNQNNKAAACKLLYTLAFEGRLKVHPSFTALIEELAVFEMALVAGGVPVFSHPVGGHDDHVLALAWAIWRLQDVDLNSYELHGVSCHAAPVMSSACILHGGTVRPLCAKECRSFAELALMYDQYVERAGCAPLSLLDFYRTKVTNIGVRVVNR